MANIFSAGALRHLVHHQHRLPPVASASDTSRLERSFRPAPLDGPDRNRALCAGVCVGKPFIQPF